jgi:ankyrin repeat protein
MQNGQEKGLFPDYPLPLKKVRTVATQEEKAEKCIAKYGLTIEEKKEADKYLAEYGKDAMCNYMWEAYWDTDESLIFKYAKYFLSRGADYYDDYGLLNCAVRNNYIEYIELFISKGASIEEDYDGITPLQIAVQQDNVEVVKMFISLVVDVNAKAYDDETLLNYAIKNDATKVVDFLVFREINVDVKNAEGSTKNAEGFPWETTPVSESF